MALQSQVVWEPLGQTKVSGDQWSVNQYLGTVKYRFSQNIDIVLFYGKYTNIDIDAQYQEIYTDILVLSVFFFQHHYETIQKHFSSLYSDFKNTFLLCLSFKKDHTMLVYCCYWLIRYGMRCLLVVVNYYHNIQKCHFL